mmetsp:Transcript_9957/g.41222  ORF Transcript_9957/g.41222 Transcript_9957/m.41222 type:complete len:209 (-) Transcript_9957:53-679(-)
MPSSSSSARTLWKTEMVEKSTRPESACHETEAGPSSYSGSGRSDFSEAFTMRLMRVRLKSARPPPPPSPRSSTQCSAARRDSHAFSSPIVRSASAPSAPTPAPASASPLHGCAKRRRPRYLYVIPASPMSIRVTDVFVTPPLLPADTMSYVNMPLRSSASNASANLARTAAGTSRGASTAKPLYATDSASVYAAPSEGASTRPAADGR